MVGSVFPAEIIARREGVLFSMLVLLSAIAGYQQMRALGEEQAMLSTRRETLQRDLTAGWQTQRDVSTAGSLDSMSTWSHFSAPALVEKCGGELKQWSRHDHTGRLEFLLAWRQIPRLFELLNTYPDVRLRRFSLRAAGSQLAVMLDLGFDSVTSPV